MYDFFFLHGNWVELKQQHAQHEPKQLTKQPGAQVIMFRDIKNGVYLKAWQSGIQKFERY